MVCCAKILYHPSRGRFVGMRHGTVQHACSTAGIHSHYCGRGRCYTSIAVVLTFWLKLAAWPARVNRIRRERRGHRMAARYPDECYYERGRFLSRYI